MPVQSSGQVSLNDLHIEAGGTSGTECSFNDSDIRGLIDKGAAAQMSMNEWYGASNVFTFNITSNTNQANLSTLATAAGWNGSAALECTINSGVYVWSNNRTVAALTVNVTDAIVYNNGYIMGQGGRGGKNTGSSSYSANSGGPAINVTATGTTIQNNSGAFIAGGGGGAAHTYNDRNAGTFFKGGGGGAGGGYGGSGDSSLASHQAGASSPGTTGGGGAQAGGSRYGGSTGWGSGGGRILPGTTHSGGGYLTGGGGANNAGISGGGGGWSASGSTGLYNSPGSGGAAITGTSRTLTNNGTIYGST
jgi:hypothetical protein